MKFLSAKNFGPYLILLLTLELGVTMIYMMVTNPEQIIDPALPLRIVGLFTTINAMFLGTILETEFHTPDPNVNPWETIAKNDRIDNHFMMIVMITTIGGVPLFISSLMIG